MTLAATDFTRQLRNGFLGTPEIGGHIHAALVRKSRTCVNSKVRGYGNAARAPLGYAPPMGKKAPKPHHYLREWRQHRNMTLEALAEAVGTTKGVISELELSKKGLSLKWLYRLAPALGTMPGLIIDYHPDQVDPEALDAFLRLGDADKAQVLGVIKVLHKKAS